MEKPAGREAVAQPVDEIVGAGALGRTDRGSVPFGRLIVVDRYEGGLAAHGEAHILAREIGVDPLAELGISPVINGVGWYTRLGNSALHPEVVAAMNSVAGVYVELDELQAAASQTIARLTGAEAGHVLSGASASLSMAVAAVLAGADPRAMNLLPEVPSGRCEIVVQRAHRSPYDHARLGCLESFEWVRCVHVGQRSFRPQAGVCRRGRD